MPPEELEKYQQQLEKERSARIEAQKQLKRKNDELEDQKQKFESLQEDLERQIKSRTKALHTSSQNALDASMAKSEFIANMSHELRTPLNGVLGLLNLLYESDLNDHQTDLVKTAISSGELLFSIINDILDFSKIEARKLDLDIISIQPEYLLQKSIDPMLYAASDKGIKLKYSLSGNFPLAIKGDLTRIRQIIANLISNAIKFTEEGEVTLVLLAQEDHYQIRVKDSGIGMSKEQLDHIFEAFSQADSTVTRTHGGTGLGLTITQRLVSMMNGKITVKSQQGKGSQFVVTLPLIRGDIEAIIQQEESEFELIFNQEKVLVVDDNYINRKLGTEMLEAHGLNISTCVNGQEALELVQKEEFDIVLMDIQMPVMNGLDATKAIRQLGGNYAQLPIIAMTAHATKADAKKSLEAGLDEHITKPVNFKRLLNTFCRWIEPHKKPIKANASESKLRTMNLPGLDISRALIRLDKNESLLIELLIDFGESYHNACQQLATLLTQTAPFKPIISLFHTIKGVSAGVGLIELSNIAAKIESAAKQEHIDDIHQLTNQLDEVMQTSLETINNIRSLNQKPLVDKVSFTTQELTSLLENLESVIDSDFNLVDETLKSIEAFDFEPAQQEKYDLIKNAWKKFDTNSMRDEINIWLKRLSGDLHGE